MEMASYLLLELDTTVLVGKGEGGSRVFLDIWLLIVSLLCTEEEEKWELDGREEEYSWFSTCLLASFYHYYELLLNNEGDDVTHDNTPDDIEITFKVSH